MMYYLAGWGILAFISLFITSVETGLLFLIDAAIALWTVGMIFVIRDVMNDEEE